MGKTPINLVDDASINDRAHGKPQATSYKQHNAGNVNKINGFNTNNGKSQNFSRPSVKVGTRIMGPNKRGVGATSYSKGAVKTALNIVGK